MLGCIGFPTTIVNNGSKEFYKVVKMYASRERPVGIDIEFGKMSPGGKGVSLYADVRLLKSVSPALSIVSSFQAVVGIRDWNDGAIFIWYDMDEKEIDGASEGLAALLCMLGYSSNNRCVTGVVRVMGLANENPENYLDVEVGKIDSIDEKIRGCIASGWQLGYPAECTATEPGGVRLLKVKDAIMFVRGCYWF